MKFRYSYTGFFNKIFGEPYLEYETLFLKDGIWRKTKSIYDESKKKYIYPSINVDKKRRIVNTHRNYENYNFYEYEIDIDYLEQEPYKLKALQNIILAKRTTDNYKDFIAKVLRKHKNFEISHNWYGGLDFLQELGILFPKIYKEIYGNGRCDLEATFHFLCFDIIDFNKILAPDLKNYNKMLNEKIKNT